MYWEKVKAADCHSLHCAYGADHAQWLVTECGGQQEAENDCSDAKYEVTHGNRGRFAKSTSLTIKSVSKREYEFTYRCVAWSGGQRGFVVEDSAEVYEERMGR